MCMDKFTCIRAVENGHLDLLIWAREHGCSWDEWTCTNAALGGHLDLLIWTREHGYTCLHEQLNSHLHLLN